MRTIKTELCNKFSWVSSSDLFREDVFDTIEIMIDLKTETHFSSNVNGDLQGEAKSLCDRKIFLFS